MKSLPVSTWYPLCLACLITMEPIRGTDESEFRCPACEREYYYSSIDGFLEELNRNEPDYQDQSKTLVELIQSMLIEIGLYEAVHHATVLSDDIRKQIKDRLNP